LDPVEKKVFLYRQRSFGFTDSPDQVIALPAQTAWVAPFDVDAHPGLELLISSAAGLFYYRQNSGVFEAEPRALIKAAQVFTNDESPRLITLATNAALPVISATHAVLYQRNEAFNWTNSEPAAIEFKQASCYTDRNEWTMGHNSSRSIHIQQSFRSKPIDTNNEKLENDAIKKLFEDLKKASPRHLPDSRLVDINGDGRKDLVLWQLFPGLDTRTDIYIFLRAADGRLPEQPSQTLHCRGFPIPIRTTHLPITPVVDLKGDGAYQLVLAEVKTSFASVSSVIDMVLSGGLECALTIRPFNRGAFSGNPVAAIPIKVLMPATSFAPSEQMDEWSLFICGDFNHDGRPDLLVRRSPTHWDIYFSTDDGRWFAPQPAMGFESPFGGPFEIKDLNGDGRADIILRANEGDRMVIFLSQSQQLKGRNP
jgi:hypothetical protein